MVFETTVSSLLNKFLGAYLENLDSTQLRIGFGGDLELKNLKLKQSALDELNLPIKTVSGHVERLALKIPYTNLWTSPTTVHIKGVFLLAIPNQAVSYNAEKEKQAVKEAKQKQLALIEEAKLREQLIDNTQQDDGFFVKLAAQIIQNLLVTIEDVHIRYEDVVTTPSKPFACGITMKMLALQTTNNSWEPTQVGEASRLYYKLLSLENLAIYWRSKLSGQFSKMDSTEQLEKFKEGIATNNNRPYEDCYIAGPISSRAKMMFNTRPELDNSNFDVPKIFLNLTLEEISMGLTPHQYQDVIDCLNNMERMNRAAPYRKYRPAVPISKTYFRTWWRFAITCVLEEGVRRRRRNWSWSHMKEHRDSVRKYVILYKKKLITKKEDQALNKQIEDLEDRLDVFNITLARRQAEVEFERVRIEQKKIEDAKAQESRGWFSWLRGGSSASTTAEPDSIIDQIKKEMTLEEKQKLYSAIGYEENATPTSYPKTFVENRFEFELVRLQVLLHDSSDAPSSVILLASLDNVKATIERRPVANALMAFVRVGNFSIDGTPQRCDVPSIARPLQENKEILNLVYETNPLDGSCDQRLHVSAEPLVILYDANTIRRVVSMFESSETSKLTQLHAAARQKLEAIKQTSSLGLEYAIQNHAVFDVAINIKGSYLVLPYGGCSEYHQRKILCNMGSLQIKTLDIRKPSELPNVRQMVRVGSSEDDILQEMFSRSYDKFSIGLYNVQIISVLPQEDWSVLIDSENQDIFILKPMNIAFVVEKCLILDDPRLPKLKISGQLPAIDLDVTDTRLINAVAVLKSFPNAVDEEDAKEIAKLAADKIEIALTNTENENFEHLEKVFNVQEKRLYEANNLQRESFAEQATDLLVNFEFHKVRVHLSITDKENVAKSVAYFALDGLKAEYSQKSFARTVDLKLKDISMEYIDYFEGQPKSISIVTSRGGSKELLSLRFTDTEMTSFNSVLLKQAILKKLEVDFASLTVTFHKEATIDLLQISNSIQSQIETIVAKTRVRCINTQEAEVEISPAKLLATEGKRKEKELHQFEGILFKFQARFNHFQLNLENRNRRLSEITVGGLDITADILVSQTNFHTELGRFSVVDPSENTMYREIAAITEGHAFKLEVIIYNEATANENVADMKKTDLNVKLKMSRLKAVFLNSYVQSLLLFINHFQEAKQAVIEASSAAASVAKENMQKVYVQATRIRLNIQFQAPYIIVPQASNSTDALIVDLGHMTLQNEFKKRDFTNEIGSPAIVDCINLNLKDLNISLASLEGMQVKSSRNLMDPISFNLALTRNLTSTWYFGEPDLKVDAQMGQINVTLSQLAYIKVMQIMLQNVNEGSGETQRESEKPVNAPSNSDHQVPTESAFVALSSPDLSPGSIMQIYGPPRVTVAFNIVLTEIKIELFSNGLPKHVMAFTSSLEKPLSRMAVQGFSLSGHMMSDLSMQSKVSLQALLLEDTRPLVQSSSNYSSPSAPGTPVAAPKKVVERAVNRLLYPTISPDIASNQMLVVDFEREKDRDLKTELHLTRFTLILCPNYLLRLLEFFTSTLPNSKEHTKAKHSKNNANAERKVAKPPSKTPQNVALTTILVRIDKPDIFLVERLDSLNTNAIVLNFEMMATILMLPEVKDISGEIKELHLYSCPLDKSQRETAIASVLKPTHLEIKAKLSDDAEGAAQINVNIGTVTLNISPGTIALLASVSKSMSFVEEESMDDTGSDDTQTLAFWDDVWQAKPLGCFDLPFLDTEVGEEAQELSTEEYIPVKKPQENLMLTCECFEVLIETGQGNRTAPLILVESSLSAAVKDWSHSLDVRANLTLQAGYYNSKLALWEPLLEPVDCTRLGLGRRRPWEMVVSVSEKPEELESFEGLQNAGKKLEVTFESADNLEVTITRSFLDVITMLSQGFSDAVNQKLSVRDKPVAHYLIRNQLDKSVILDIVAGDFVPEDSSLSETNELILEPNCKIGLKLKPKARANSLLNEVDYDAERIIQLKFPELSYERGIPVSRSSLRFLAAGNKHAKDENVGIVADISNDFGFRSITLRSIVQVRNHFHVPIDVYFMTKSGNEVNKVGQIGACGVMSVPPYALYTPTGELFFAPLGFLSTEAFVWRDLQRQKQLSKVLQCTSRVSPNNDPFYLRVGGNMEHILFEDTKRKTIHSFCYEIHLRPTVLLHNSLPIPLYILTCGTIEEITIKPGDSSVLSTVEPGVSSVVFKLKNYMARDWACKEDIKPNPQELTVWSFISYDGSAKASLDLGVFSATKDSTLHLNVYCPFWMVNNTGLLLTYKHSGKSSKKAKVHKSLKADEDNWMYHDENLHDPVLFSYRPKSFFGKKTAVVRVEGSEWSDKFSLDAAGSSGLVTCKSKDGSFYQLGVTVHLGNEGLTKQVIFTPYYILSNLADYDIEACELLGSGKSSNDRSKWVFVPAKQSVPFWPQGNQKLMIFRVAHTEEETVPLYWDNPRRTLLRLDNRFGGIDIDFQVSESSTVFVCNHYEEGRAPLLLVNQTEAPLTLTESNDASLVVQVPAYHAYYYTWKNPNGSRKLSWDSGSTGKKGTPQPDVMQNGSGSFVGSSGVIQWISFLHGRQRILLFTREETLPFHYIEYNAEGLVEQNVRVLLHSIGLSLVDNINRREIMYAGITSSGVVWETAKKDRSRAIYRPVNMRENGILEDAYQQYLRKLATSGSADGNRTLADGWIIDFEKMMASKPKERFIRRTYKHGCEFSYLFYGNRRLFHLSLYKIQIDNQLDDCVFPVVFAPVPPPRSVATESIPHPFVEISIVEFLNQQSDVNQYEYFKLLVQECHVRIDMSLINAIGCLFVTESELKSEIEHKQNVELDLKSARQGLHERTRLLNEKAPENYFKNLHLSPLKIHLSFSNTGSGGAIGSPQASNNPASQLLNLIVQSVGVSITEVQDAVFRLGYFERNEIFLSWQQLARDLQWHYTGQAIKQFYVLVFGLDVIGNPFGLALGISHGVEQLFYEPFQGAIQGPGEFVEGLALGARSLLSNTLGGVVGAASRITGTIGKGLSFLTFDEDYQKSRRELLVRRPTDIGENLAQGGKGLLMGVVEGVSGVVLRPIEGAQQHGVGGFFTGIGKGVVGLVTRPTAAMADFASGSLDAMKKAADVNDELSRLRPPRHLQPDGIVRPYVRYQADGDSLLKLLDKGRFARTDHYVDHVRAIKGVLLVTDRRIILMNQDLFNQWQIEWAYTWDELAAPPVLNPNGLYVPLKVNKKVFGVFASNESGKLVNIQSAAEKCEAISKKVEALMKV